MFKTLIDYWRDLDPTTPRTVTEVDREAWYLASQEAPPRSLSREQLLTRLTMTNPVRMRRIRKDYAWMQRQLKKAGRNPEDARWLL